VIDDARWLGRALGPARDLDVLLETTLPRVRASLRNDRARAAVLDEFATRVAPLRDEARAAARAAVASPRYAGLVLGAGGLATALDASRGRTRRARARLAGPVVDHATALIRRRHRALMKRGRALDGATDDERHAVRLAAKKLRYVTEFFAPAFGERAVDAYRRALVRLQNTLGEHNDLVVAARLGTAIDGADAAIVHLLREASAAGDKALCQSLDRRWKAFVDAPRPANKD